jgi:hypothetical protein
VLHIIRQAQGDIVGFFTGQMDVCSHLARVGSGLQDIPVGQMSDIGRIMRQGFMEVVTTLSARMTEVLVALPEVEPLDREWAPEEIEQAKAEWSARVVEDREQGRIGPWPPAHSGTR